LLLERGFDPKARDGGGGQTQLEGIDQELELVEVEAGWDVVFRHECGINDAVVPSFECIAIR
jgi:hypothetical protein